MFLFWNTSIQNNILLVHLLICRGLGLSDLNRCEYGYIPNLIPSQLGGLLFI